MIKTDPARTIPYCASRSARLARLALGALVVASACSLDSNGLREPPTGGGSGAAHQTGAGGAAGTRGGTGGLVAGGTSSGGSGPSSSGDAGVASGGRPGTGGAATASGGTIGGASGGSGGTGAGGTGAAIVNPGPGSGGSAVAGSGGTIVGSGSGGATATGGINAAGGGTGAGGRGGSGNTGGSTTAPGGRGGGAGGASPFICGPTTCANGCCEGNSCITTRTDARCGKAGASCTSCDKCFHCADGGSCEVDPNSTWRIICSSAVLSETQSNGAAWDATSNGGPGFGSGPGAGPGLGGPGMSTASLPDPVCQLSLGLAGADVATSVIMNTTTPKWDESITPALTPLTAARLMAQTMPWSISVSDDDDRLSSDLVCRMTPQLTSADFAATEVTFPSTQACISLSIRLECTGG